VIERLGITLPILQAPMAGVQDHRLAVAVSEAGGLGALPAAMLTHQQLAAELGSVREIVSRLLKGFAEQGLVALGREQLTVIDRAGLLKVAAL
jgi:CRP/FNR family transcriptional regulator